MRRLASSLAITIILVATAHPALAWNKPTHMVIGAIAYDVLKQDSPDTLARVLDLLKAHPDYDTFAKRLDNVPPEERDRYLFMQAARWADDIRDNKRYHHGSWHYVNYPVTSKSRDVVPAETSPDELPKTATSPNIDTAIADNEKTLKTGTDGDKAVAVCWLMHLIGDLHQPLNTVSYFDDDHPKGDRGGNDFFVRVTAGGAVIDLHSFWDGLLGNDQKYRAAGNLAVALRNRPDLARKTFAVYPEDRPGRQSVPLNPKAWTQQSVLIAKDFVYVHGTLRGGTDRSDGPVLPAGYAKQSKAIAERQVVLAGYRLADVLKAAMAEPASK